MNGIAFKNNNHKLTTNKIKKQQWITFEILDPDSSFFVL